MVQPLWLVGIKAVVVAAMLGGSLATAAVTVPDGPVVRSAASGAWSAPATWEGGVVPAAGSRVLIRPGHRVTYDVDSDRVLRSVRVAGHLSFATDRDTRMDVGLLIVGPGDGGAGEAAAVASAAVHDHGHGGPGAGDKPAEGAAAPATPVALAAGAIPGLEIGTIDKPVAAGRRAIVRLTYIDGDDKQALPAVMASGGRMELHGAPMNRTWVKLGRTAEAGEARVELAEPVSGWRVGDRIIVVTTAFPDFFDSKTRKVIESVAAGSETEERTIRAIDGATITLDRPLAHKHLVVGDYRGEVANLSRNVVIESADPNGVRGHTMYHRGSRGSISYAEFRHLGKKGVLAAYPIHYHLAGDSMRGSSVIGASIWDSGNRWLTVHGTDYVVVRDVVGYKAIGHGFFLEDGTEVNNVFDRNLAVQALRGAPLPDQALAFDKNDGAGFWWANSLNSFTRNVAAECDQHGYRYEVVKDATFDPVLPVRQPDGTRKKVDVRTLPFIRFDDNETHSQRRFGLNLGGIRAVAGMDDYTKFDNSGTGNVRVELDPERVKRGDVGGVGPDPRHPFVIRNFRAWTTLWAFHGGAPSVLIDGMNVYDSTYGIWRSRTRLNVYRNISMSKMGQADVFHPWGGNPSIEDDYDKLIRRTDDRPPVTVVTGVSRTSGGDLVVRGTTADDGDVTRVTVNGAAAKATSANFGEWEATLAGADARVAELVAGATDKAGNVEKTPHKVRVADAPAAAASR